MTSIYSTYGGMILIIAQFLMFTYIFQGENSRLEELVDFFIKNGNEPAMLLSLDHYFSREYHLEEGNHQGIVLSFERFLIYARTLQRLSCDPAPCDNLSIRKIFAFSPVDEETNGIFLVPKQSYLFALCAHRGSVSDKGVAIPQRTLDKIVARELKSYLKEMVLGQKEMCFGIRSLRPCLRFSTFGVCSRDVCLQFHKDSKSPDGSAWYNLLVRIHVLELMILHTLYATDFTYVEFAHLQR